MSKQIIVEQIEEAEKQRKELFALQAPINKKLVSNSKKLDKLRNKLSVVELAETRTSEQEIEYYLSEEYDEGMVKHTARESFWREFGLHRGGMRRETKQSYLEVALTYNDEKSLEKNLKALEKVLPYIKSIEGYKKIGIFEHTLSEFGSYELLIKKDEYSVSHYYGYNKDKFKTLRAALEYIQKNHWYDGKETDGEEDY